VHVAQRERHALAPRRIAGGGGIADERNPVAERVLDPGVNRPGFPGGCLV